jgi:hypothetical protein
MAPIILNEYDYNNILYEFQSVISFVDYLIFLCAAYSIKIYIKFTSILSNINSVDLNAILMVDLVW